jgi:hypothetical protein
MNRYYVDRVAGVKRRIRLGDRLWAPGSGLDAVEACALTELPVGDND